MLKRAFDVLAALVMLTALAPAFMVLALLVKFSTPGPIFHRALRVGRGGKVFAMCKFRTMETGTAGPSLPLTRQGDPRVTALGRCLRRAKLDELPQLFNVLKGDMSLVGPRPEDPHYVALYTREQRRVLEVRPGLVSPAVLAYLHEEELLAQAKGNMEDYYLGELMPAKLQLDLEYLANRSFLGDLAILGRCLGALPARILQK